VYVQMPRFGFPRAVCISNTEQQVPRYPGSILKAKSQGLWPDHSGILGEPLPDGRWSVVHSDERGVLRTSFEDFAFRSDAMIAGGSPRARRPRFKFGEMGIRPNSKLRWYKREGHREDAEATVLSDTLVEFRNSKMFLTAATQRVLGYRTHPCPNWTYNGTRLSDKYDERYGRFD